MCGRKLPLFLAILAGNRLELQGYVLLCYTYRYVAGPSASVASRVLVGVCLWVMDGTREHERPGLLQRDFATVCTFTCLKYVVVRHRVSHLSEWWPWRPTHLLQVFFVDRAFVGPFRDERRSSCVSKQKVLCMKYCLAPTAVVLGPPALSRWRCSGAYRLPQTMFISERRWIKVVAHVIRRLWDMDGKPSSFLAARARQQQSTAAANAVAAGPLGVGFQQPAWRPVGGGRRVAAAGGRHGGAERFLGADTVGDDGVEDDDYEENPESFLGGLTAGSRSDSAGGWGASAISADDADGGYYFGVEGGGGDGGGEALRAWEEEGEGWVGAGRSLAWAPGGEDFEEFGAGEEDSLRGEGRLLSRAPPQGPGAATPGRRRRFQHGGGGGGGGGYSGENGKEGTRPAGMWEVTPPAHVAALRRGRRQGGGGAGRDGGRRGGGPAYLRGVQSRIGPQLDAHKERLRKVGYYCMQQCCSRFFMRT